MIFKDFAAAFSCYRTPRTPFDWDHILCLFTKETVPQAMATTTPSKQS